MLPCLQAHLLKDVMNDLINADVILINEGQFSMIYMILSLI